MSNNLQISCLLSVRIVSLILNTFLKLWVYNIFSLSHTPLKLFKYLSFRTTIYIYMKLCADQSSWTTTMVSKCSIGSMQFGQLYIYCSTGFLYSTSEIVSQSLHLSLRTFNLNFKLFNSIPPYSHIYRFLFFSAHSSQ